MANILSRAFAAIAAVGRAPVAAAISAPAPAKKAAAVDGKAYVEPASRPTTEWTPELIRAAARAANNGDLRRIADICEDLILCDDRAAPCLGTRVRSLLAEEVEFEANGDGRRKNKAVKALDAEEDWYKAFPEHEHSQLMIWARLVGAGPGHLSWSYQKSGRVVPALEHWNPRNLRFEWSTRQWMMRVALPGDGVGAGQEIVLTPGDGEWVLSLPYGKSRPWNNGLWRQLALWCLLKQYAQRDIALYGEVHGNPIKVVKPNGAKVETITPAIRKALASDLAALGRNALLALPAGFDFALVEATAKTYEVYQAQTDMANMAIAVAILGQNMTTEPKARQNGVTGAREVRGDLLKFDAMYEGTFTREQALKPWAAYNYGSEELAPWPTWPVEDPEDVAKTATTWNTVAQTINTLRLNGYDLDTKEVTDRFNMPIVKSSEPPRQLPPGAPGAPSPPPADPGQTNDKTLEAAPKNAIEEERVRATLREIARGEVAPAVETLRVEAERSGRAFVARLDTCEENQNALLLGARLEFAEHASTIGDVVVAFQKELTALQASGEQERSETREKLNRLTRWAPILGSSQGFDDGQDYAERLGDNARESGAKALGVDLVDVIKAIEDSTSAADLRTRLVAAYKGMGSVDDLTELTQKALIMAELAGKYAVLADL